MIFLSAFLVAKFAFFDEYYVVAAMLVTGLAGVGVAFPAGDVALPDVHELCRLLPGWGTPRPLGSPVDTPVDAPADAPAGAAARR